MNRFYKFLLIFLIPLTIFGCSIKSNNNSKDLTDGNGTYNVYNPEGHVEINEDSNTNIPSPIKTIEPTSADIGEMKVYFIDVGNADSHFIQMPDGTNILIDGGNNEDGEFLVDFLKKLNVDTIDIVIGTHSHEDHIGGLDVVINNFDVEKVYFPRIPDEHLPTTRTFKDFLQAIYNKGLSILSPSVGEFAYQKQGINVSFLNTPSEIYSDNMNDYSILTRIQFGNRVFIFTGDIEESGEILAIKNNSPDTLKADVLKIAHHGSKSSSIDEFLSIVRPEYGFIPTGAGNKYGHPHQIVLDRLNNFNIKIYRADFDGTVVMTTNGLDLSIETHFSE